MVMQVLSSIILFILRVRTQEMAHMLRSSEVRFLLQDSRVCDICRIHGICKLRI